MAFLFDPSKSRQNLAKHGIDFVAAQRLWDDPKLLEARARAEDEARTIAIGMIGEKHWSAIVTCRGDDIRIISVRRSRKNEVALYESQAA